MDVSLNRGLATPKALIDTGAPVTVFPRGAGDLLGVNFPEWEADCAEHFTVYGPRWGAVRADVEMAIQGTNGEVAWSADVLFSYREGLPYGILGREGFLDRWAVAFNGYYNYFIIEPMEEGDERYRPATRPPR